MKTVRLIIVVAIILSFANSFSQNNPCACCTEPYRQFDFWLGDWEVFDTTGKQIGTSLIVLLQDSCVIQENWNSISPYSGISYNYYNSKDSMWHQTWVNNQGGSLELFGNFSTNKMFLRSELLKGKKVDKYYNRITWTANKDGSVRQIWEILDEKDNVLNTAFNGLYKRKNN